ncbi:hypothetical protein DM558_09870 [Entomomonas moraniae]|uniref:Uncharacterized protein n=1 Tax=Entomomonas moraniae TaxID=2213226 RepID=A0A3Q9JNN3_9GAMM|nr:hypothetical protein DM558_09870 [Entomomonas moraniae]
MIFAALLAISFILLIGTSLISFNEKYKITLILVFSFAFFVSVIGCVIFNYSECASGNISACEAFNNTIIN